MYNDQEHISDQLYAMVILDTTDKYHTYVTGRRESTLL